MGSLKGKRALVTGGGQGLGYAVTEQLLSAGVDVAIHYFSSEKGARQLKADGFITGATLDINGGVYAA